MASQGLCALSLTAEPNLLALPAAGNTGSVQVYDLMREGGSVLCELAAHKTPLVYESSDVVVQICSGMLQTAMKSKLP